MKKKIITRVSKALRRSLGLDWKTSHKAASLYYKHGSVSYDLIVYLRSLGYVVNATYSDDDTSLLSAYCPLPDGEVSDLIKLLAA